MVLTPAAVEYNHFWCSILLVEINDGLVETEAAQFALFDNDKFVEH